MKWLGRVGDWLVAHAPVRQWATIVAGPVWLAFTIGVLLIVWLGHWPAELAAKRLDIIGWFGLCSLGLQLVVLVSISGVGVNFKASKDGVSGELGGDEEPKAAVVTTTTTETKV